MRLVIVESPLSGDVPRNIRYARACMRDALLRGDAPFASHLLYAQEGVLDDLKFDERALGIAAGFAWGCAAKGVPSRVDRLRCLGNAVVPQVAEWIGRQILAHAEGA